MDAHKIARQFVARDNMWLRSTVLNNFTPRNWFECDVFQITDAGYFVEYEIKISRSDYFADAKKYRQHYPDGNGCLWDPIARKYPEAVKQTKHELLNSRDEEGPSRFFFITPKGMLRPVEIPVWAALIEAWPHESRPHYLHFEEIVKAPRLHKKKADEAHRTGVYRSCYSRLHSHTAHMGPICSIDSVAYRGPEGAD
jgi:hypothetical protein